MSLSYERRNFLAYEMVRARIHLASRHVMIVNMFAIPVLNYARTFPRANFQNEV